MYYQKTIKVPYFHRRFFWEVAKIKDLMDSIYKGYPIGGSLVIHKNIHNCYILDGYQRLHSIDLALKGLTDEAIYFSLEDKSFYLYKKHLLTSFPLDKIRKTSDFLKVIDSIPERFKSDAKEFSNKILNYKIPVIEITDITEEQAKDIYIRLHNYLYKTLS